MKVLLELFVDDGMLALALLAVVAAAALFAWTMPGAPLATGLVLVFGCLCSLFANVMKAARR